MNYITLFMLLSIVAYSSAMLRNVNQCKNAVEKSNDELGEAIKAGSCKKAPCRLRKKSTINFEIKLKPDKDVEKLTNTINAIISGIPFPFIGYDGTDACQYIYKSDGKTKNGCPLKAGEEYVYKLPIEVLEIYPRLKVVVHWGLTLDNGQDLFCFEIPARITN